jgi:hypothetical protein
MTMEFVTVSSKPEGKFWMIVKLSQAGLMGESNFVNVASGG